MRHYALKIILSFILDLFHTLTIGKGLVVEKSPWVSHIARLASTWSEKKYQKFETRTKFEKIRKNYRKKNKFIKFFFRLFLKFFTCCQFIGSVELHGTINNFVTSNRFEISYLENNNLKNEYEYRLIIMRSS